MRQSEAFKAKAETLLAAKNTGSLDAETARWIAALPDAMHARLAAVGLVEPRAAMTLSAFLDSYLAGHTVKPQTLVVLGHAKTKPDCLLWSR